ncbi:hypothetical protein UFOVP56_35 [uncultured Caudovirales phage]|jgi:hypothetical protein|uniref:Terminase small subunit n=1 Tax=uncultured Caudovirales phage TaxID=2100421 RepID=A0A6J5TBP5_9CAUD|nr:hypothetical protein UFOVP56_35 [uncultured Caudovirales phage]
MATEKKKMGRPPGDTLYPNKAALKEQLVNWLSEGKTLQDFCRQEGAPAFRTMYNWEAEDTEFAADIARARNIGHDAIAEHCLSLADKEPLEVFDEAGNKRYDPGSIAWRKMQIETRVKLLAKWNPRKYGDKTILAGDDQAPVVVEASFDIFGELLKNITLKRQSE